MNKKDMKVYNIGGLGGLLIFFLLMTVFLIVFVLFPVWGIRELWDYMVGYTLGGPDIVMYQAFLLWLAGFFTIIAILRKFVTVKFQRLEVDENDGELKDFLNEMSEKEEITEEDVKKFEEIINTKK